LGLVRATNASNGPKFGPFIPLPICHYPIIECQQITKGGGDSALPQSKTSILRQEKGGGGKVSRKDNFPFSITGNWK
jgi:hypothetical protein